MVEVKLCNEDVARLAGQILEKRMKKPRVAEKMPKMVMMWPRAGAGAR